MNSELIRAISDKRPISYINKLLKNSSKADINKHGQTGFTPLHRAISKNSPNVVRLLIKEGANVNKRSTHGHTPLSQAIYADRPNMARMLINAGANVNAAQRGRTLLNEAVIQNRPNIVQMLLSAGAKVNFKSGHGKTLLHYALRHGMPPNIIRMLINKGANVDAKNTQGRTAYNYAYRNMPNTQANAAQRQQIRTIFENYNRRRKAALTSSTGLPTNLTNKIYGMRL
jgi:ankyrin repeat protein